MKGDKSYTKNIPGNTAVCCCKKRNKEKRRKEKIEKRGNMLVLETQVRFRIVKDIESRAEWCLTAVRRPLVGSGSIKGRNLSVNVY
jgi:hypothetical protein